MNAGSTPTDLRTLRRGRGTVAAAVGMAVAAVTVAGFGWFGAEATVREARSEGQAALSLRRRSAVATAAVRLRDAVAATRAGEPADPSVQVRIGTVVDRPARRVAPTVELEEISRLGAADAQAAYRRLTHASVSPSDRVGAHRSLARLLRRSGHRDDAVAELEEALAVEGAPERERLLVRYELARSGEDPLAADTLTEELVSGAFGSASVRDRLAVLHGLGTSAEVRLPFEAVLVTRGETPVLVDETTLAWRLPSTRDTARVALVPWPAVLETLVPGLADGTFASADGGVSGGTSLPEPFPPTRVMDTPASLAAVEEAARREAAPLRWAGLAVGFVLFAGAGLVLRQERARAELERRRDDFLCAVTHELKTPVANVLLYAETLRRHGEQDPASVPGFAGVVATEALRLDARVQELLDVAAGRREPLRADADGRVDVATVVEEVAREFEPRFRAGGVGLETEGTQAPLWARGDASLVGRALRALVENALQFGGGRADLRVSGDAERVVVEVCDQGRGIPEVERERVFEPFERLDDAKRRAVPGTGLGLPLARRCVERCGGSLECVGGETGTTMRMVLCRTGHGDTGAR